MFFITLLFYIHFYAFYYDLYDSLLKLLIIKKRKLFKTTKYLEFIISPVITIFTAVGSKRKQIGTNNTIKRVFSGFC